MSKTSIVKCSQCKCDLPTTISGPCSKDCHHLCDECCERIASHDEKEVKCCMCGKQQWTYHKGDFDEWYCSDCIQAEKMCSLCGQAFFGIGHNPEPLKDLEQRCCDECNEVVLEARSKGRLNHCMHHRHHHCE